MTVLAKRLRSLREKRGWRQKDIAEKLGITESAYGYYEQGRREPSNEILQQLGDIFSVSVDYLLGRTNDPTPITNMDEDSPIPNTVKAWLRADTTGLTEEEQQELAKDLADYFEMRKRRILRNKGLLKDKD